MTHCRHLPSGEPHINITLFSTDTILIANVLIITFVSLIESEELTSVQPLHIIPFGYEPWHKITEHCAWNYALHVHWSSFIKKFCFSWIWATFSLYHAHQQSRHAQATQLLLCVSKSRNEKKKKKIIPKKEWIMFFSYCSRPWLTPADAKKVPTFLSRVFLHLFLPYSELSKCLCYWSFLARISTWLPAYLSFNHFSLNPYTSNIPLKCHSQLSRQNYLTIQNHLNIQNHSSFLCVNFNININVCHLPVI